MTESILKSLLRLFAIVAQSLDMDKVKAAKGIVESYLRQLVNPDKINQYLMIYDFYYKGLKEKVRIEARKRDSLYSVKSVIICEHINRILEQRQKALALLQIMDIMNLKEKLEEGESDYIKTLSVTLRFNEGEYNNSKAFIFDSIDKVPDMENALVIDSNRSPENKNLGHIRKDYLKGKILFLFMPHTNIYVFRYVEAGDQLYLNGRKIVPERTYILDKGASIRSPILGSIYYSEISNIFLRIKTGLKLRFTAIDIEFRFRNSENGIYPFSFSAESGQMIGIMGGSGVGKSTLLNLLNGNFKPANGKVLINGYDVNSDREILEGIIGYIPQDDLLIEELTVFQNMYFNTRLCFKDFTDSKIIELVNKVLADLDLFEVKDLKVGNPLKRYISGGQRKRLNIALELVREPYILFVDEPTSGLSSTDSEMVMDLLKRQTRNGKLLIVNIHQPSSDIFRLFDKLLVMDKGGRVVYYGDPLDAIVYFKTANQLINAEDSECLVCGNVNPEQVLQIIEAKKVNASGEFSNERLVSAEEWYQLYKKKIEPRYKDYTGVRLNIPESFFSIPGKLKQFIIFTLRNIYSKITDRQYLAINLLEAPVLAFILGIFTKYNIGIPDNPKAYIFSDNLNLPVFIFMGIIVALFLGLMVSAEEIIRDRKIIQRESFLNLSKFSYFNSKVVLLALLSAIQSLLFVLTGNCILGINDMFIPLWLMLFSLSFFSNMLGLNISDTMKSVVSIYILIPLLLVPQILLGGAMVKFDKLNKSITSQYYVPFVGDLMASRWAYEALLVYQFKNNRYQKNLYSIEKKESHASFMMNYLVPELQLKLTQCEKNYKSGLNREKFKNDLMLLKNELQKISANDTILLFKETESLDINVFNLNIAHDTRHYLNLLGKHYSNALTMAIREKDNKLDYLKELYGGITGLLKLKNDNYNDQIAELVLNKRDNIKIIEHRNNLIQRAEPIYKAPESNYGRSHFFAPFKRLGNLRIDTFWFNMMVIWVMILILYTVLIFELLKKIVNFSETIRIKNLINR
jgi:ABC-type multidrug transport system ATPase subunit